MRKNLFTFTISSIILFFCMCVSTIYGLDSKSTKVSYSGNECSSEVQKNIPGIHIFIHVCTLNNWEDILLRELNRIKSSGLYDASSSISLGILGGGDLTSILELFPKLTILFQDTTIEHERASMKGLYERATLKKLHEMCLKKPPDTAVLYLHTKGITRVDTPFSSNVTDWCLLMEYFTIEKWKDCIEALKNYDACGVNYRMEPMEHFSGNFWWATAGYIATLTGNVGEGHYPEFWIGLGSPKVKCFHESYLDHYFSPYPESKYIVK